MLCSWARHLTLTVPLPTQKYSTAVLSTDRMVMMGYPKNYAHFSNDSVLSKTFVHMYKLDEWVSSTFLFNISLVVGVILFL